MTLKLPKPFSTRSRSQRKSTTFRVKHQIQRASDRCGGLFYDQCDVAVMAESGRWTWSDIIFLSADKATFWNATILTASDVFTSEVENLALERASAIKTVSADILRDEETGRRTLDLSPLREPMDAFGGLSWSAYVEQQEEEIARNSPPAVYCGYRILPGFRYGIGLEMIVDADVLSIDVINTAIRDFWARGEKKWTASAPASVVWSKEHTNQPLPLALV
ncbi:MAG: hypothetical protein ACDS79_04735 [Enterobacteriaceae bacterium]